MAMERPGAARPWTDLAPIDLDRHAWTSRLIAAGYRNHDYDITIIGSGLVGGLVGWWWEGDGGRRAELRVRAAGRMVWGRRH